MVRKHNWRCLIDGDGDHTADKRCIVGQGVSCHVHNITWESGLRVVVEGEGDTIAVMRDDGPILLIITYETAMKGVFPSVLVLRDVAGNAVDCERAILDAVHEKSAAVRSGDANMVPSNRFA